MKTLTELFEGQAGCSFTKGSMMHQEAGDHGYSKQTSRSMVTGCALVPGQLQDDAPPKKRGRPATFPQRRALFNMRRALGLDMQGIHDVTFDEASAEIDRLKKVIEEKGFPVGEEVDP